MPMLESLRIPTRAALDRARVRMAQTPRASHLPLQLHWGRLTEWGYRQALHATDLGPHRMSPGDAHSPDHVAVADVDTRYLGPRGGGDVSLHCPAGILRRVRIAYASLHGAGHLSTLDDATAALMHNVVMRAYREFSAPGWQSARTAHLRGGDVFVDVGCFRGYLALKAARRVGPEGRVLAFEPDPVSVEFARTQAEDNGLKQLETYRNLVVGGSDTGEAAMFASAGHGTANSAVADHLGETRQMQVPSIGITRVVEMAVDAMASPDAGVVLSITTNGTEPGLLRETISTLRARGATRYCVSVPILYTAESCRPLAAELEAEGHLVTEAFPWLTVCQSRSQGTKKR